jgi:hypothetical protein
MGETRSLTAVTCREANQKRCPPRGLSELFNPASTERLASSVRWLRCRAASRRGCSRCQSSRSGWQILRPTWRGRGPSSSARMYALTALQARVLARNRTPYSTSARVEAFPRSLRNSSRGQRPRLRFATGLWESSRTRSDPAFAVFRERAQGQRPCLSISSETHRL